MHNDRRLMQRSFSSMPYRAPHPSLYQNAAAVRRRRRNCRRHANKRPEHVAQKLESNTLP